MGENLHSTRRHSAAALLLVAVAAGVVVPKSASVENGVGWPPDRLRLTSPARPAGPVQSGAWSLEQGSPDDRGTIGARWPAVSADGLTTVFSHDGDLPSRSGPGNPDANTEVWSWRGAQLDQVTATSRTGGATPAQTRPSVSGDGTRIAFVSTADLNGDGGNADHSPELWVTDGVAPPIQVTASDTGSAEGPMISADGQTVAFWYTGDLDGLNPEGGLELYLAQIGGSIHRLTDMSGTPYHDLPAISADGNEVAVIAQADLAGHNPDGSWELFRWQGPPTFPGDPARFEQVTDWAPPLPGREIYHSTISADGNRIAFAGRGHVDVRLVDAHTEIEIYLWSAPDRLVRLTTATARNASSLRPQISGDGTHIAFVSLSDFAPGAPGNPERNQELFVWSTCGPVDQVTAGTGRGGIIANVPETAPPIDEDGDASGFVSELAEDPHPIALTSRRGVLFRAIELPASPCGIEPGPSPTSTATEPPGSTSTSTPTMIASITPTTVPPIPTSSPTPPTTHVCPQVAGRIPSAVVARALTNPEQIYGWDLPSNPALPPGRMNPPRRWLSIRDIGKPYSPVNGAVWKAGCP